VVVVVFVVGVTWGRFLLGLKVSGRTSEDVEILD
jgi:hypothetical protein